MNPAIPLISIIIPAYNAGRDLCRCLESVRAQTYAGLECVVVDDGSTDGSVDEARAAFEGDRRFIFVCQPNGGVSSARNRGLSQARGEYICFIDSDDYVDCTYVQCLYETIGNTDMSVCGLVQDGPESSVPFGVETLTMLPLCGKSDDDIASLIEKYLLFGPVCKLYRNDIIRKHKIGFPVGISYGEDLIFNLRYLERCVHVSTSAETPYHYIVRPKSLSTGIIERFWELNMEQWLMLENFFAERGMMQGRVSTVLYKRLAGLVVDSLFRKEMRALGAYKRYEKVRSILGREELRRPEFVRELYKTTNSRWIKFAVRHRLALPFMFV